MSTILQELQRTTEKLVEQYTPEDLLRIIDGDRYELIDGNLVERNRGAKASIVAANVIRIAGNHVHPRKLGKVFATDCGYQIFPDRPKLVRFPDASFIAKGRLSEDKTPDGHIRIPPDLGVEVVSPNDLAEEVEAKRIAFLQAGTRMLWMIYPEARTVHVYRQAGTVTVLTAADELHGEDVLPDFVCRVADFFEDI